MTKTLSFPPYSLRETRTGSGTPVVLLHGLSGSSRWWSRNIEALASEHLVAAVDLPRFLPSFGETTALLARWLETFGEPVNLIGHSMGGQLAIALTAEHPELVRSLILVNAAGMPFKLDPRPHVRAVPHPPYGGASIARVLVPDFLRTGPASVAVYGARVVRGDMRAWMHAIRVPTLLVWGENDPLVPLVYGEAMQEEIAGSRLVVIPGAAHVAMWDTPAEFNALALSFLRSSSSHTPALPVFSWGLSGFTNGIAHRQCGSRRDIVLVHGLGMSSSYFVHLARELYARGFHPIAPDLPGFGESNDAPAASPSVHAQWLASWADSFGIRNAIWLGHSTGCNAVAHVAASRPDLVSRAVYAGPIWTPRRSWLRIFAMLTLDAFREPLSLYRYVLRAYWRTGLARWLLTWLRHAPDLPSRPASGTFLAGTRDPLPDREFVTVREVEGAHACVFSRAGAVAAECVRSEDAIRASHARSRESQ